MEITLQRHPTQHRKKQASACSASAIGDSAGPAPSEQKHHNKLKRLKNGLIRIAYLVEWDADFLPFFIPLEEEIEIEEAKADPLARARAMARLYKAMPCNKR